MKSEEIRKKAQEIVDVERNLALGMSVQISYDNYRNERESYDSMLHNNAPAIAQAYLDALAVLEKIANYKEGHALRYVQEMRGMARQFLQGGEQDVSGEMPEVRESVQHHRRTE